MVPVIGGGKGGGIKAPPTLKLKEGAKPLPVMWLEMYVVGGYSRSRFLHNKSSSELAENSILEKMFRGSVPP